MAQLRIALAQINATVGDLPGNRRLVLNGIARAAAWRADVVVFPELAVTGYPPEDLLLKSSFVNDNLEVVAGLERAAAGLTALVGFVDRDRVGRLYDAAAVLADERRVATYHKQCLPNYGVFDEQRYFTAGDQPLVLSVGSIRVGVTICEDLWEPGPAQVLSRAGCDVLVNLSASPYHAGKPKLRRELFATRARDNSLAIAYCNLVGGQDELVFDGASFALSATGQLLAQAAQFAEDFVLVDVDVPARAASRSTTTRTTVPVASVGADRPPLAPMKRPVLDPVAEVYAALVLGTRDYVDKNGFETVVLGLSGGVDSALTACIAVDALGPARVVGLVMPSRYSSPQTQDDARKLAATLGIRCETISIESCFGAFLETLQPFFGGRPMDVAEQNVQARIRGTILMAFSNKFGWLVLTTGNKSETGTGYCTLYGDMAGGFAVIKDVPKTLVYQLARWRNRRAPNAPIPASVLTRPPTAELAPNQLDQDTLPPYDVLDRVLTAYIEEDRDPRELVAAGRFSEELVRRVTQMVDRSEYKRRQAPPGIKVTPRAFGRDRRLPITNRYQDY